MIRVAIPFHLRNLARVEGDVMLDLDGRKPITMGDVLDAIEARYPMLRGTIRDHITKQRRPFLRYFACEKDWSLEPLDVALPDAVVSGKEPFIVLGSIAGG
jgi:hypothetical protein